jgi:hypothetical protein
MALPFELLLVGRWYARRSSRCKYRLIGDFERDDEALLVIAAERFVPSRDGPCSRASPRRSRPRAREEFANRVGETSSARSTSAAVAVA